MWAKSYSSAYYRHMSLEFNHFSLSFTFHNRYSKVVWCLVEDWAPSEILELFFFFQNILFFLTSRNQCISIIYSSLQQVAREQKNFCETQSCIHLISVIGQLSIEQTWFIENDFLSDCEAWQNLIAHCSDGVEPHPPLTEWVQFACGWHVWLKRDTWVMWNTFRYNGQRKWSVCCFGVPGIIALNSLFFLSCYVSDFAVIDRFYPSLQVIMKD